MRVLLINNHHEVGGGSERVYRETASLLKENGHEVAFVSTISQNAAPPEEVGLFYRDEGYRALRLDRFFYKADVAKELSAFIRCWRPDVAHLHIFYGRLTSAVLRPLRQHEVPTVMSLHEYRMLCPTYLMRDWKGRNCEKCASGDYWHAITNRCNSGSVSASAVSAVECYFRDRFFDYPDYVDRFLFVSKFCRDIHLKYRPELRVRSEVLYNASAIEVRPATPSDGAYILYAGRLSREKGVRTLLESLAESPLHKLRIAGSGPEEAGLRSLSRSLALSDRVEFLGYLSADDLHRQVQGARWVVLSSECYENNPLSIIEAFAQGVPAIGSRIGGIPELVVEGETGLLFEPRSVASLSAALQRAAAVSDGELDAMGRRAWQFAAQHCDRERYYDRLVTVYAKTRHPSRAA